MTQTELAHALGISQSHLSRIYNGLRHPSYRLAKKWERVIGNGYEWWRTAPLREVQKLINRMATKGARRDS